jgi:type II secretory pathway component PulJ
MGFSTIIDILGSIIISGILMTIAWRLSDTAAEKTFNNTGELTLQENLLTSAEIIEYDFRKIGYCANPNNLPNPTRSIPFADTSSITFYTDMNSDGNVDTVRYYLGPVDELASTPNPRDRMLYRVVNSEQPRSANLGITKFYMKYFDVFDEEITPPVTLPGLIASIEITLVVENTSAYNEEYSSAIWRQIRLASRNINTR